MKNNSYYRIYRNYFGSSRLCIKHSTILLCILILLVFISGCWDTREISNQSFITAIAIDIDETSDKTRNSANISKAQKTYRVTVEIIKPVELLSRKNLKRSATIIHTAKAESIHRAIEKIQAKVSRALSLSHLKVLLIGEKAATEDFRNFADYFEKQPDVASRLRLLFVRGKTAAKVLRYQPSQERYVAEELVKLAEAGTMHSFTRVFPFTYFLNYLRTNQGKALGTVIQCNDALVLQGGTVLKNWQAVSWLDPYEIQQINWLLGYKNGTVTLEGNYKGGIYTYNVDSRKAKIESKIYDRDLKFQVTVQTDGILLQEQDRFMDLSLPVNIDKLKRVFSEIIKQEIEAAIKKSQKELSVDYLGFGMSLYNTHPDFYSTLNWEEVYPKIPIVVDVQANITRFGLSN